MLKGAKIELMYAKENLYLDSVSISLSLLTPFLIYAKGEWILWVLTISFGFEIRDEIDSWMTLILIFDSNLIYE